MMFDRDLKEAFVAGIIMTVASIAVAHCLSGCQPKGGEYIVETVENAAAVAQYKLMLGACRERGRASHSYDAYEQCADEVDAELCRTSSLRCGSRDGGRDGR